MKGAERILLALLLLLALAPPETRGEAMAGGAVLIALSVVTCFVPRLDARRAIAPLVVLLGALPLVWLARAPGSAVEPLMVLALTVAVGLAAAAVPKDRRSGPLLPRATAIALVAVSGMAIYQKLFGLPALVEWLESGASVPDRDLLLIRARTGRAFAGFPTPAALGGWLVLMLPVAALSWRTERGTWRWFTLAALPLGLIALIFSASVTALAAGLVAIGIAAVGVPRLRRQAMVVGAVAVVLLAGVAIWRGEEVLSPGERGPWKLRAHNFWVAGAIAGEYPWVGAGPGGFGEEYPRFRQPHHNETQHVHDLPLELVAEYGLPLGAAMTCVFFILFLGPMFRRISEVPVWWIGGHIGLAAFALHNLADFTAFLPSIVWTAALLRGWVTRRDASVRADEWRAPVVASTLATIVAACVLVGVGVGKVQVERARQAVVENRLEEALSLASSSVSWAPWEPDSRLLHAQALLDTRGSAALQESLQELDRVVVLTPVRPVARYLRSRVRRASGDLPGAWADATLAVELHPAESEYADYRVRLGEAFRPEPAAR